MHQRARLEATTTNVGLNGNEPAIKQLWCGGHGSGLNIAAIRAGAGDIAFAAAPTAAPTVAPPGLFLEPCAEARIGSFESMDFDAVGCFGGLAAIRGEAGVRGAGS